ncbi:PAS domain-containing protein [Thermodesulfobacteriota bacterium]
MNLESILKNLVTSGIGPSDPAVTRKYIVLNIFNLTVFVLAPVMSLFYYYIGAISLFYTTFISGILMIAGIIMLRKTKNLLFSGNYSLFILWAVIAVISWKTGPISYDGIINPLLILNAGLILLAIFLNGYQSGTIWAIIIFIQTGFLIFLFRSGYQFSSIIPPEITVTYYAGTFLLCLLTIMLFAFLFEIEKNEALKREDQKSDTIRESKKYMDSIFNRYPLPAFVLDRRHRVIQWNSACSDISGLSSEESLGKKVWEGFHINEQGSIADIILEDMESISDIFKDEIVESDAGWFEINTFLPGFDGGKKVIITAAPILDDNGIIRGSIQTIQELKRAHVECGSQAYMEDTFPAPVFIIDDNGKINFWNDACEELLGYSSVDISGKNPLTIVAKNYRSYFKDTFIKALKGESFSSREWRYKSKSGKSIYVNARVLPVDAPESESMECVVINTDITKLRLKLKKLTLIASESNEKYKSLQEEYDLLKKNVANFIRRKEEPDSKDK